MHVLARATAFAVSGICYMNVRTWIRGPLSVHVVTVLPPLPTAASLAVARRLPRSARLGFRRPSVFRERPNNSEVGNI